jgi:hypothetical protein
MVTDTTIGTVAGTGVVDTGAIQTMTVTQLSGTVTAHGQGTIDGLSVGTLSGTVSAPEDTNAGSGTVSNTTIGTVAGTGVVDTGAIQTMTVTELDGTVTAHGQGTIDGLTVGTLHGKVLAPSDSHPGSGKIDHTKIGTVDHNGLVKTNTLNSLTVTQSMNGQVIVTGTLNQLSAGNITGSISAGTINNISAKQAAITQNVVFTVQEGGVTRQLTVTPVPTTVTTATTTYGIPAGLTLTYYYEGQAVLPAGVPPQVTVQVNGNTTGQLFDVALTSDTAGASGKFNLAGLFGPSATAAARIHDVAVAGDLLTTVTSAAATYLE